MNATPTARKVIDPDHRSLIGQDWETDSNSSWVMILSAAGYAVQWGLNKWTSTALGSQLQSVQTRGTRSLQTQTYRWKNLGLPQVRPSVLSASPGGHSHSYPPSKLVQLFWQFALPFSHSSMSTQVPSSRSSNPGLHEQVTTSPTAMQICAQPPLFSKHGSGRHWKPSACRTYPSGHEHSKPGTKFVQVSEHPPLSTRHSSISAWKISFLFTQFSLYAKVLNRTNTGLSIVANYIAFRMAFTSVATEFIYADLVASTISVHTFVGIWGR